jgi:protein TonB
MLHIASLGPPAPRLPRPWARPWQFAAAASLQIAIASAALGIALTRNAAPLITTRATAEPSPPIELTHMVFIARDPVVAGSGGGGGGNQQPGPIRRAEGMGRDRITVRIARPATPDGKADIARAPLPELLLDARPLASGTFDQIGLPDGGVAYGFSTGPGSGGGVGDGVGIGIGPGRGPGMGPGEGGGIGGGPYRPGGAVTSPRVLNQVSPSYTSAALLRRIQGTVGLELIVRHDGRVSDIRVVHSLDPGGLDGQAVEAVSHWRFEPGRLAGEPVDVLVSVLIDFSIR